MGGLVKLFFPLLLFIRSRLIRVTLLFAVLLIHLGIAARMCRIGSGEPRFPTRFPSCAAVIFGFFHEPRPVRTIPFRFCVSGLTHAFTSTFSERNSVPSAHIRCNKTANFRATATIARRRPFVRIKRIPHVLICDPAIVRIRRALAAA